MTVNGKIATFDRNDDRAGVPGHGPVLLSCKLKENDGEYPVGLLLTKKSDGIREALQIIADEVLGAGDGSTSAFTGTLAAALPIEPGTLVITDGTETFSDDGLGNLVGDAGGSGSINYKTGVFSVTFNANVANAQDVTAGYITALDGVLDDLVDTTKSNVGLYVAHGTCREDMLKIGATAQSAPSTTILELLQKHGIYAV